MANDLLMSSLWTTTFGAPRRDSGGRFASAPTCVGELEAAVPQDLMSSLKRFPKSPMIRAMLENTLD